MCICINTYLYGSACLLLGLELTRGGACRYGHAGGPLSAVLVVVISTRLGQPDVKMHWEVNPLWVYIYVYICVYADIG